MLTCFADTQVKGEGRWRDGDIRRHGAGADKVTTALVYTGPSQLWTIGNLQQALITMQRHQQEIFPFEFLIKGFVPSLRCLIMSRLTPR